MRKRFRGGIVLGASGWWYETEYGEGPEDAFMRVQAEVLANKEYYRPWIEYPDNLEDAWIAMRSMDPLDIGFDAKEMFQRIRSGGDPVSAREVLSLAPESGSHSILDLVSVGTRPDAMTVAPLDEDRMREWFGSTHPSSDEVRSHEADVIAYRDRWEGTYVVAYDGDTPSTVFFGGYSGA